MRQNLPIPNQLWVRLKRPQTPHHRIPPPAKVEVYFETVWSNGDLVDDFFQWPLEDQWPSLPDMAYQKFAAQMQSGELH